MNGLSIIIPSRTATNLRACLDGIRGAGETCRIIVVDDGIPVNGWCDIVRRPEGWANVTAIDGSKPFIFSRNMNLGIAAAGSDDVVLLNDDAVLETPGGFSLLQREAADHPEFGIIAATTNSVGNTNQLPQGIGLREDQRMVCFIAVLIPRTTIDRVGLLDERFTAYGGEDNAYCMEVRRAGLKIGIHDGCFVDHRHLPSTFRGHGAGDIRQGQEIYKSIYGEDYSGRRA
jgi:GT2 family glycosyltransferase